MYEFINSSIQKKKDSFWASFRIKFSGNNRGIDVAQPLKRISTAAALSRTIAADFSVFHRCFKIWLESETWSIFYEILEGDSCRSKLHFDTLLFSRFAHLPVDTSIFDHFWWDRSSYPSFYFDDVILGVVLDDYWCYIL